MKSPQNTDTLGLLSAIEGPKRKANRYPGVFKTEGKKGNSYGIDYIHSQTGERVRKILKGVLSEVQASELRSVEIADAARGAIQKTYGLKPKPQTIAFEAAMTLYLQWSRENKSSWDTDEYRSRALRTVFKGKLMSDINPSLVEKYKSARLKDVGRKTVNAEISLGSQVYEKANEWKKYEEENPFRHKGARYKVKRGKKPGALTVDQVMAIRSQIGHPVKRAMLDFDFYTGWRIGEIRKLKWEDVNLEAGKAWIMDPKNGQTVEIDLSSKALALLAGQKRRGVYVFCHLTGKPFKTNLHAAIKNAAARAGVTLPPRKAWHILRRTWASLMLQNGCDVETLRVLGNWKDYQMPLWYAEAGGAKQRKAALDRIPDLNFDGRN